MMLTAEKDRPWKSLYRGHTPTHATMTPGAKRLSADAAGHYLGFTKSKMRDLRKRGKGPKWYIHMDRIAYDVTDLDEYKNSLSV